MKKKIILSSFLIGTCLYTSTPVFAQESTTAPKQAQQGNKEHSTKKEEKNKEISTPKKENNTKTTTQKKENSLKNQWVQVDNHWYYYNEQGVMLKDTFWNSYYFFNDGKMASNNWIFINQHWYYAKTSGSLAKNEWVDSYYLKASGEMAENEWIFDPTYQSWFYLTPGGSYAHDTWKGNYYLKSGGYMAKSEWIFDPTYQSRFYLTSNGSYAHNTWQGDYYLKTGGYMAKNEWIFDPTYHSWFYLTSDGSYAHNTWQGDYYLKTGGYMAKSEWIFDPTYQSWFYLTSNGSYAHNTWQGNYYLKTGGYMAKSEWIFDPTYQSWFYLEKDGSYVTGIHLINETYHSFKDNGEWIKENGKEKPSNDLPFATRNYNKVIFLDPGHGGKDPGANYLGVKEKDLTLQVSQQLKERLENLGYKVIMSRSTDVYVDFVTKRSEMANETNADMFISIHFNATGLGENSSRSGIQTYTYLPTGNIASVINKKWHDNPVRLERSKKLGSYIHQSVLATTHAKDDGLLAMSFAVLRETNKPAVLLELGYIDNLEESQKVRTKEYQQKLVDGITQGIQKYYNN